MLRESKSFLASNFQIVSMVTVFHRKCWKQVEIIHSFWACTFVPLHKETKPQQTDSPLLYSSVHRAQIRRRPRVERTFPRLFRRRKCLTHRLFHQWSCHWVSARLTRTTATTWVSVLVIPWVSACAFLACHSHTSAYSNALSFHFELTVLHVFDGIPRVLRYFPLVVPRLFALSARD